MRISGLAFSLIDWEQVPRTENPGTQGVAHWRTLHAGDARVRLIDYSPGYVADHWCPKGHIVLCLSGELHTELADGRLFTLRTGQGYHVADDAAPHRSYTAVGARLFVVD